MQKRPGAVPDSEGLRVIDNNRTFMFILYDMQLLVWVHAELQAATESWHGFSVDNLVASAF